MLEPACPQAVLSSYSLAIVLMLYFPLFAVVCSHDAVSPCRAGNNVGAPRHSEAATAFMKADQASSGSGPSESEGALGKRAARLWKACLGRVFHR
jgi:hypothetical protein